MNVKLIAISSPLTKELWTPEELIVYCARVSNPSNQSNTETSARLLKYCFDHKHWSVFEMADMTVEIETSRAISAQILRHRSFVFQEFSQRYATANLGFENVLVRRKDDKNRQNSFDDLPDDVVKKYDARIMSANKQARELYEEMLSDGVAPESARFILPLNVTTRLYMKGNVRSWIHYLQTRLDPSTQKEHRDVALAIFEIFKKEFPLTAGLMDSGNNLESTQIA